MGLREIPTRRLRSSLCLSPPGRQAHPVLQCPSIVIPDGSLGALRARRADPGPKYPGIRELGRAGVHGSRLSRLKALGRDDNREPEQVHKIVELGHG